MDLFEKLLYAVPVFGVAHSLHRDVHTDDGLGERGRSSRRNLSPDLGSTPGTVQALQKSVDERHIGAGAKTSTGDLVIGRLRQVDAQPGSQHFTIELAEVLTNSLLKALGI